MTERLHPETDPSPAPEPDTDPGGHAPVSYRGGTLDEEAHQALHLALPARIERARDELRDLRAELAAERLRAAERDRRLDEHLDRIERAFGAALGDSALVAHEEQRHGQELARARADLDALPCRRPSRPPCAAAAE